MTQLAKLLGLGITDTAIEKWEKNQNRPTDAHRKQIIKRSEEHTSELQSQSNLVCRLLLEKKKIFQFQSRFVVVDERALLVHCSQQPRPALLLPLERKAPASLAACPSRVANGYFESVSLAR